jgi:hypothetical protein
MSTHRAEGRDELANARWSSRGGTCVEVANLVSGHRAVRDSKNPTGPALIFTPAEWATYTTGVHDGEFRLLG